MRIAKSRQIGAAALLAAAVLVLGVSLTACGSSSGSSGGDGDNDSYRQLLTGFNEAVLANETFGANDRARELDPVDKAVVEGFCIEEEKLVLNRETDIPKQRPHWISRTFVTAERMPSKPPPADVRASENELIEVLGSSFFNGNLDKSFEKACYK